MSHLSSHLEGLGCCFSSNHHELFVVYVFTYDVPHLHAFLVHVIFVIRCRWFEGPHLIETVFPIEIGADVVAVSDLLTLTDIIIGSDTVASWLVAIFRVSAPPKSIDFDQLFDFCYLTLDLEHQILQ